MMPPFCYPFLMASFHSVEIILYCEYTRHDGYYLETRVTSYSFAMMIVKYQSFAGIR